MRWTETWSWCCRMLLTSIVHWLVIFVLAILWVECNIVNHCRMLVRSILQWLAILHSTQRMASENITNQCRMLVIDYITLSAKYGQVTNITNQCRMLVRSILQWLAILHSTQRMASENITNQCRMLVIDYITLSAKYGQVTNITNQCRMLVRSILQWLAILHSTQSMASANITNQCRI